MPILYSKRVAGATLLERLLSKVEKDESGCWLFLGAKTVRGYGILNVDGKLDGAHRVSYYLHVAPIPPGYFILHTCDNPSCVNPAHLFPGTSQDNTNDMFVKKRNSGYKKLSLEQVKDIRRRRKLGISRNTLAREYGVTYHTIRNADLNLHYGEAE